MVTVLVAGGGTGGHVYPMVAVADALRAERADVAVVFVGTGRGIESRVIPARGDRLELLDVLPLRGGGLGGLCRGVWRAIAVLPRARALVRRLDPDVVFSVGGYAAGPVTLAAQSCAVPVTLLEPNAVLGFTNRLLGRFVQRAYVAFPELEPAFGRGRGRWTGVPLRRRFAPAAYSPRAGAPLRLLVMGGSQGASALNDAVPPAVAACVERGHDLMVVHQTGRDKDAEVRQRYDALGVAARVAVVTFIDDVSAALAAADVVIERAGASSLGELCAVGRASILVPYPFAADDHQYHNARSLAADGAAVCVPQREADVARLTEELSGLCGDHDRRAAMARAAAARGRPDAAAAIARDLLALAQVRRRRRLGGGRGAATGRSPGDEPTRTDAARAVLEVRS